MCPIPVQLKVYGFSGNLYFNDSQSRDRNLNGPRLRRDLTLKSLHESRSFRQ